MHLCVVFLLARLLLVIDHLSAQSLHILLVGSHLLGLLAFLEAVGRVFLSEVVVGFQLILKLNLSFVQLLPQFLEARFLGHLSNLGLFLDLLLNVERLHHARN
jgi:hypothetical protein